MPADLKRHVDGKGRVQSVHEILARPRSAPRGSHDGSMRQRVVRVAAVAVAVGLVFAVPLAITIRSAGFTQERGELERDPLAAASGVGPQLASGAELGLRSTETVGTPVGDFDMRLRLRAGRGPSTADSVARSVAKRTVTADKIGRDVVAPVPVLSAQDVVGVARAAVAARVVWQRVILAWLVMGALAAISLLIAILVARRRARLLSEPCVALSSAPQRCSKGDLTVGAELCTVREIRREAGTHNAMVRWLARAIENRRHFSANASHQQRTPRAWLLAQLSPDQGSVGAPHPIAAVMGRVETRWHDQLDCEDRRLVVKLDPEATATEVPACLVTQVLDVLIDNALRHGRGDVTLTARQFGETLAVDVADEGSIAMESAAVFDRGTSGGDGQRASLTLARSMVETRGGRLVVGRRSPATFTLLLPGDTSDVIRPRWLAEQRTSPASSE